jgi:hypothetical protein
LSIPCDYLGDLFAIKLASKAQMAAAFLGKNISFPINPYTNCPKSRCNLVGTTTNTTMLSLLSGVPLFDLFNKMGVTLTMGANQLLNFDVTKLNKVGACILWLPLWSSVILGWLYLPT